MNVNGIYSLFKYDNTQQGQEAQSLSTRLSLLSRASAEGKELQNSTLAQQPDRLSLSDEFKKRAENSSEASPIAQLAENQGAAGNDGMSAVEKLKKQIEEVQKRLEKAYEKLAEATSEAKTEERDTAQRKENTSDEAELFAAQEEALSSMQGQAEVAAASVEVKQLTAELLALNKALMDAIKAESKASA